MPTDTTSALLGLLLQATGNNNNTWGDNLNNFVFAYLEQAVAGYSTKTVTGGAATLTAAQRRSAMIEFNGVLTSNCTVTMDNTPKRWRIFNNTSGNFVLLLKTAAGAAIEIPQGTHKDVICNGADVLYREDEEEVGTFVLHGGTTPPPGTLACAGGTYVRADHPNLFSKIGTTWGAGNGVTTAGLPNLTDTNRFLRAAGGSIAVGTYQASQNKAHNHTSTATTTVTGSTDSQGAHSHTATSTDSGHSHSYTGPLGGTRQDGTQSYTVNPAQAGTTGTGFAQITTTITANGAHTHTISASATTSVTVNSDGGTEARPESAAVLVCIKI